MSLRTDYVNATLLDDVHPAAHNDTNLATNTLTSRVAALEAADVRLDPIEVRAAGLDLAVGIPTFDRASISAVLAITNQRPYCGWITAPADMTVTKIRTYCGTAAAPTPTSAYLGVYREETNGDLTLLATTANMAGLIWTTADTAYEPALTTPVDLVGGARYALAMLVASSAALPTFPSASASIAIIHVEAAQPPRRSAYRAGNHATLLPSWPVSGMAANWIPYLVALP